MLCDQASDTINSESLPTLPTRLNGARVTTPQGDHPPAVPQL